MQVKQWKVDIYISESGDDTDVRAVLTTKDGAKVEGTGHARRNPRDRMVPEIGDEVAAARALLDLGHRLEHLAAVDVESSARGG